MSAPAMDIQAPRASQAALPSSSQATGERIELLGADLLEAHRPTVESFRSLGRKLGVQLGWHYLLDLSWAAARLRECAAADVLDAGAGLGLLQWWLADHDTRVTSVDRLDRQDLSFRFRARYPVIGLRRQDLNSPGSVLLHRLADRNSTVGGRAISAAKAVGGWIVAAVSPKATGQVVLYHADLSRLVDIRDSSVDAVVAISSLEHNSPEVLPSVVRELMRVLRPGGRIVATLAAAREEDWFHQPSRGWCYTEGSLRRLFGLDASASSNFKAFDDLMAEVRASSELKQGLAPFHFRSGENGMPWGVWDPKYLPVGVVKVKTGASE